MLHVGKEISGCNNSIKYRFFASMIRVAWAPEYEHPLPEGHRFPMEKYSLLHDQLVFEGTLTEAHYFRPEPLNDEAISLCHDVEYWQSLKHQTIDAKAMRKTGFPLSQALVYREALIAGGTWMAAQFALREGAALNIAGGTHHSYANRGEGFCLLNDIALASCLLLKHKLAKRILVVDLDVHQGNGTAHIFRNESRVFTFSMHGAKNYPHHKEVSDCDVELPDGTGDTQYLELLEWHLNQCMQQHNPDFLFFQSGVDVLAQDKLGRLGLSMIGCKLRDTLVFERAYKQGIPIVAAMGGGYAPRVADIVEAHAQTFRLAAHLWG